MLFMWGHIKKCGKRKPKLRLLSSTKEEENRIELKTALNKKSRKSLQPKSRNAMVKPHDSNQKMTISVL